MSTPVPPTLESFAEQLYETLAPLTWAEPATGFHLARSVVESA